MKIFDENSNAIDVTQLSFSSSLPTSDTDSGSAPKRRRLETGWTLVRQTIGLLVQSHVAVPWLRVLRILIAKFSATMSDDEHSIFEVDISLNEPVEFFSVQHWWVIDF